jgi:HK97 family phage portal protein
VVGFVVSDGQLASIGQDISPWGIPGIPRGIELNSGVHVTYGEMYRTQPAIRTVVSFLASNIASLALKSYRRLDDTDRERLAPDMPGTLAFLLERQPNPTTTAYRMIHALISDRATYDMAYLLKVKAGDGTVGLRRIPVPRIRPSGGDWFEADRYRITGSKGYMDVPREQLIVFPGYSPDDNRVGVSPIETLRQVLAAEASGAEYMDQLWRNGARVASVIERPVDAPEWDGPQRERFLSDWRNFTGSGGKAGGTPLLEDGMSLKPAGVSPREAQRVEGRKLTREEVASAYHIPPPLVGILDHATFSNIREQHIQLYVDTLGSWCESTEQEFLLQLVPDFYGATGKVYVEFDINAKLRGDFEGQAQQLQSAIGAPYMTRNEGRARLNLPRIDGGDELVTPLNVTQGGQASPQDSAPPPKARRAARRGGGRKAAASPVDIKVHVDLFSATFERQRKAVMTRYATLTKAAVSVAVDDVWDRARWDRELSADLLKAGLPLVAAVGTSVAGDLGGDDFDPSMTVNYIAAQTAGTAGAVNRTTEDQLPAALAGQDPATALEAVFLAAIAQRALAVGRGQAANLAGWGSVEAARQSGLGARKAWETVGPNPRPAHAAMNGQTVALDDTFSNGARWPADDVNLDVDDVAGCTCVLVIIPEGVE